MRKAQYILDGETKKEGGLFFGRNHHLLVIFQNDQHKGTEYQSQGAGLESDKRLERGLPFCLFNEQSKAPLKSPSAAPEPQKRDSEDSEVCGMLPARGDRGSLCAAHVV